MKHTWTVTFLFVLMFLTAQVVGLYIINLSTNVTQTETGEIEVAFTDTVLIERPEIEGTSSVIYIVIGVAIGTLILLFLAKKSQVNWWRAWFMLAVWLTLTISLGVIFPEYAFIVALIAAALTLWKVYRPNIFIHNVTEILTYSGIAVLLAPILNVITGIIVLIIFSIYDMYAVWKSKHMVALAQFTSKANLFPGLSIPYTVKNNKTTIHSSIKEKKSEETPQPPKDDGRKTGMLGGGDVVFPLIFAGIAMLELISTGYTKQEAFLLSMIVVAGALSSLLFLFTISKKDKFYPAMPYLTTGCLLGYGVLTLVLL